MYAIYGNIYHQYTPNVSIYSSTMDPMGNKGLLQTPTDGSLSMAVPRTSASWHNWLSWWRPMTLVNELQAEPLKVDVGQNGRPRGPQILV